MFSEEKQMITRVLEHFILTGLAEAEGMLVTCLPENKTSTMEKVDGENRTVLLDEFKVNDRVIWAAYCQLTNTIFLSPVSRR